MSEFLEGALAQVHSIGFEKTLFFGRFQMTFVDFFRSDGTARKFTLGLVIENGDYYRSTLLRGQVLERWEAGGKKK